MDFNTVKELASVGRNQECLHACRKLLQSEPRNPLLWKYSGKSLLALGEFKKALQDLNKARQLDDRDPEITQDIGNTHFNKTKTKYNC